MKNRNLMLCVAVGGIAIAALQVAAAPPVVVAPEKIILKPKLGGDAERQIARDYLKAHPTTPPAAPPPLPFPTATLNNNSGIKSTVQLPPNFKWPTPVTVVTFPPGHFGAILTFDDVGLVDGSPVDAFYSTWGATLSVIPGQFSPANPHVLARKAASYFPAETSPNMVSVIPIPFADLGFDERDGIVKVTFAALQRTVSVFANAEVWTDGCFGITAHPYLRFYDDSGTRIFEADYAMPSGASPTYTWQKLTWTAPNVKIRSVQLAATLPQNDCHVYAYFDQLSYAP
jgi:hypothetical protein